MIVVNFAHPLTEDHLSQVERLTGVAVARVISVDSSVDVMAALGPQVTALADACGLSPTEWQTLPILVNPPSLNYIAVALLAELHGRCGYFPAHLRLRPVAGVTPTRYEVAEILDLQTRREAARSRRPEGSAASNRPGGPHAHCP